MGERGFPNISDLEMSHHHHVIMTITINHVATVSAQVSASCSIEVPRVSSSIQRKQHDGKTMPSTLLHSTLLYSTTLVFDGRLVGGLEAEQWTE